VVDRNNYYQQKYKVVNDHQTGDKWAKERIGGNETYRHEIQTGPRGGQYFTNTDGRNVYESKVSKHVSVYPQDSKGAPDRMGYVPYR